MLYPSDTLYPAGDLYPNEPQTVGTGPLVPSPTLYPGNAIYPGMLVGGGPEPAIIDAYMDLSFSSGLGFAPSVVVSNGLAVTGIQALTVAPNLVVSDGLDTINTLQWVQLGGIEDGGFTFTSTATFTVAPSTVVNVELDLESWLEFEVDFPQAVRSTSMTHYVVGLGDDD